MKYGILKESTIGEGAQMDGCKHDFFIKHSSSPLAHHLPDIVKKKRYKDVREMYFVRNNSFGVSPIFIIMISAIQLSSTHQI